MKNQKQPENQGSELDPSSPDVEKHVDQMMSLDRDQATAEPKHGAKKSAEKSATTEPPEQPAEPINIFADLKSAPEITPELIEQMSVPDEPAAADIPINPEEPVTELADIEDPETDKVVDEIVKEEGNTVLDAEDGKPSRPSKHTAGIKKQKQGFSLRKILAMWWRNKLARYSTIAILVLLITAAAVVPTSRYGALNLVGFKASASLTVLDGTTKLPLKNVEVSVGNIQALTDIKGTANLTGLPLGKQVLTVHKIAFSTVTQTITVGLGSNSFQSKSLRAVGNQYHFAVTDYVSGKPVKASEATSGQASALADKTGQIILTSIATTTSMKVDISAAGYRTQTVTIPVGATTTTPVQLVSIRPDVFVSKASGNYDVLTADIDGKNRNVILKGTGLETAAMSVIVHATDPEAAVVSTRDNLRNADGYLLDALTLVNTTTGKTLDLDHAENIQLVDWIGDKLVYVRIKAGTSAGSPERYQLESYDYKTGQHIELVHANGFNDVISSRGSVYYAASNDYDGGMSLFGKVAPDGTSKQTIQNSEIYNIFWPDYNDLNLSAGQDWFSYHFGATAATKLTTTPPTTDTNKIYIDSPNRHQAAFIENRDGQGVLSIHDDTSNKDTVLAQAVGLSYPVRWLDNTTLIYRVASPTETADYVVSTLGGTPKKVTDLTNVPGVGRWYYYH
jgi:hypothetical protein